MVIQLLQSLMRQDFRLQLKTSILIQLSSQLRSLKVQLVVGNLQKGLPIWEIVSGVVMFRLIKAICKILI